MILLGAYALALQCEHCKKVYSEHACDVYNLSPYDRYICPNCGEVDELKAVVARPRLFGLLGYEVKEDGDEVAQ